MRDSWGNPFPQERLHHLTPALGVAGSLMNLYLAHCGFYDTEVCDGLYESHVNFKHRDLAPKPTIKSEGKNG